MCENSSVNAIAAVENNGSALRHASDELRANKSIVMAAVNDNCSALQFASEHLQQDDDVWIAAQNSIFSY